MEGSVGIEVKAGFRGAGSGVRLEQVKGTSGRGGVVALHLGLPFEAGLHDGLGRGVIG